MKVKVIVLNHVTSMQVVTSSVEFILPSPPPDYSSAKRADCCVHSASPSLGTGGKAGRSVGLATQQLERMSGAVL